ncbi:hypothetical protein XELAEV_18029892mg [Xenopus laevis]|uniref:Amidohydrolase-related domain-containing protein n=1 Tax=Xenopus laevis TaxID=8355 RepID=A0A974CSQ3_XENLA|nr:hypothetical protein XELAEV_18029892mg [Xenopus laevis]
MDVSVGSKISIVRSRRVVTGNTISPADIIIKDGKIMGIQPWGKQTVTIGSQLLDAGDLVVMPGIIDPHVHVNEPGRSDWEGYSTATRAAAAGAQHSAGYFQGKAHLWTRNSLPPTTSVSNFHTKLKAAEGQCFVDVAFWGGVIPDPMLYETFLASRPPNMEVAAVEAVANLQYKVRCHIVHLSSAMALPIIRKAKKAGAPLSVETTHHYLTLSAEKIPPGATYFKFCPPVREHSNKEALWNSLLQGHIDMVVSDHSPCTPDLKLLQDGDFLKAWGGICSLQLGSFLFWSSARTHGFSLLDIPRLLSSNPAKLCSVDDRKGTIKPGYDADLVILDPDKEYQEKSLHHKNKLTPYQGFQLWGEIEATIVGGILVYYKGRHCPVPA